MPHESPLISVIVIGLGLAFVLGTLAQRLRISPLVGYLLAGVVVGPFTPGFVADPRLILQLAEIGVILLMFGVGLHFSAKDLIAMRAIILPAAIIQISLSTLFGMGVAFLLGWSAGVGIVFGLSLSVASTIVMLRALQERRMLETDRGRLAIGWLVVQDIVTVLVLVLLPALAGVLKDLGTDQVHAVNIDAISRALAITLGKLTAFVIVMFFLGRRLIPRILHYIAHTGSRELFRLAVLTVALGVAFAAAELFGVSIALGAFFAGMILSESPLSQRAAEESLPFRDAFAVLFFVSVGVLFNPSVILREPVALALVVAVVIIGNGGAVYFIVRKFGYPLGTALFLGAGFAQTGEFSFILANLGIGLGLMPENARDLILGASIISILANPFMFALAERLRRRGEPQPAPGVEEAPAKQEPVLEPTGLSGHAVLVGYGRVGRLVGDGLRHDGVPLLVIENAPEAIRLLRNQGVAFLEGNGADKRVLQAANLAGARILFVAIPEAFEAGQIVEQARRAVPNLHIIARAHIEAEADHLRQFGANTVIIGEHEIARAMLAFAHQRPDMPAPAALPPTSNDAAPDAVPG